ncbi:CaiB/BaiF CoA transferase family protein [Pararhodospirillum oryzae]|uniref:CoA transferase n=1 Tax=Pararhodospirillum oryzae TaxID=478448 RepID=A0A512H6Y2_9PROT|nr:CoA transferase [Pararhodospirillum oryzae]GEO81216.1 CoA transferase [Pararhodospirillum oryzae]
MTPLPLAGVRVLDIATFIAAPFAAALLGEFGAEVIKIEQPEGGDPLRRFGTPTTRGDTLAWLSEARNKASITLDLRTPRGAELFRRLVPTADVVCENFRPGTLERWGLGWETLSALHPGLILLRVSGYGQTGPYRDRPGFARIAHAFGGLTHLAGLPGGPPVTPGSTSLADYMSGLFGAVGLLVALRHRDATGQGQVIDLGLYESVLRVLDELAPAYAHAGIVRGPEGAGTRNACPHGHFPCADGGWVAIACTNDKMFERLARVMGRPELAGPDAYGPLARRLDARASVDGLVEDWTRVRPQAEVVAACTRGEVPCAPINTIADLFVDPHVQARGNLVEREAPGVGPVVLPDVLPRLSATPGRVDHPGPALGADTTRVLRTLGLSDDEIETLRRDRVI